MPFRPEHSLLRVEVPAMHTIDTSSVESLFGMWSLFSKASHAMEDGKRLENLSWRLWNRETFCCAPDTKKPTRPATFSPFAETKAGATDIPVLDSASSDESSSDGDETVPSTPTTIPKARPELRRISCECGSVRREKHITPGALENLVTSITETKLEQILPSMAVTAPKPVDPTPSRLETSLCCDATPILAQSCEEETPHQSVATLQATLLDSSSSTIDTNDDKNSQTVGSEGTSHTEMSTDGSHFIIRGFNPSAPSSYRSQTNLSAAQPTPILKTSAHWQQPPRPKKKGAMFTIGTSSGEEESSLESHMYRSSLSEGLRRPTSTSGSGSTSVTNGRKQTSFREEVAVGRAADSSAAIESDSDGEGDNVDSSAIEDDDFDDSSDWEDSDEASGASSVNDKELFQRVDSRPNLTSRRSLLTTLMHEPDRAKALANAASRSTPALRRSRTSSPNGPSGTTSPETNEQEMLPGGMSRPRPIIMTTSNTHPPQLALSPRTTRRNMLSTELTESLRKNLLWERQHRSTGNLAALKRRHTSTDMKNLKQHPEPAPVMSHQDNGKRFSNEYFHAGLQEYHAKGW